MISELDETIRQLLIKEGNIDLSEIDVSFVLPSREWSATISRPTINCYLFDVRENRELRDEGWEVERQGNAIARRRPPLRFNLAYLMTVWTRAIEDEHHLIWHVLQTLSHFAVMPVEHLQGRLQTHELPIYAAIARTDGVLKTPTEVWGALGNQIKPALTYVVTLALDRDAIPAGPPVLSSSVRFRQLEQPVDVERGRLGGVVRDADGTPVSDALVQIEGHTLDTSTNDVGQYVLPQPAPGRYTLVARSGQRVLRRELDMPAQSYDLAFESALSNATDAPSAAHNQHPDERSKAKGSRRKA